MIELSLSLDSSFLSEELTEKQMSPSWDKIGKVAFGSFTFIGGVVFYSGMPRKRSVTFPAAPGMAAPPPVEGPEVPPPPRGAAPPIQAPPGGGALRPVRLFDSIRNSAEDRRKITEVISTMGRYSLSEISFLTFIANTGKFRQYERDMESVEIESAPLHPFKFLSNIFANPALKRYMPSIFNDFFLRTGFMSGVVKGMERETARGNVEPYIEDFAQEVGVLPNAIRLLIRDRAWELLVRHLIAAGAAREGQRFRA